MKYETELTTYIYVALSHIRNSYYAYGPLDLAQHSNEHVLDDMTRDGLERKLYIIKPFYECGNAQMTFYKCD